MPKECAICGKKSIMAGQRKKLMSRYNPTPKKRKYPNLQKVMVFDDVGKKAFRPFVGKRIVACAKCIKSMGKG